MNLEPAEHSARETLLHMAPKWSSHRTTRAGLATQLFVKLTSRATWSRHRLVPPVNWSKHNIVWSSGIQPAYKAVVDYPSLTDYIFARMVCWANMMLSTKLEVCTACRHWRTEPRPQLTCTENFVKFGRLIFTCVMLSSMGIGCRHVSVCSFVTEMAKHTMTQTMPHDSK